MTTVMSEWRERRRAGVGGSEVAAILGLSPFASPLDVWLEKTGRLGDGLGEDDEDDEDDEDAKQKQRGNVLEPAVANWYAAKEGAHIASIPQDALPLFGSGRAGWMHGSPDRLVHRSDALALATWKDILASGEAWGLEAKTARHKDGWGEDGSDVVPTYYATQALWYMAITGFERWDFAVYFPFHDDFRSYTLHRDHEVEARVVDAVEAWWQRHVVGDVMPDVDGSKAMAGYLLEQYRTPRGPSREASDDEASIALHLHEVKQAIKRLKQDESMLANKLKLAIGENGGLYGDFGSVTWGPVQGSFSISLKDLRERDPVMFEQLRNMGFIKAGQPTRRLTVKPSKKE